MIKMLKDICLTEAGIELITFEMLAMICQLSQAVSHDLKIMYFNGMFLVK